MIRDDAGVQAEVEGRIQAVCSPGDLKVVEVTVHDGSAELAGRVPAATRAWLAAAEEIADVVEVKTSSPPPDPGIAPQRSERSPES